MNTPEGFRPEPVDQDVAEIFGDIIADLELDFLGKTQSEAALLALKIAAQRKFLQLTKSLSFPEFFRITGLDKDHNRYEGTGRLHPDVIEQLSVSVREPGMISIDYPIQVLSLRPLVMKSSRR